MGNIWIGPWAIFPQYMDPTLRDKLTMALKIICINYPGNTGTVPKCFTEHFRRALLFVLDRNLSFGDVLNFSEKKSL